ncbi:hypothetical protein LCGC14_0355260 [marine sediment metagenome]|uniref:GH16 domain-containing protein n=1 Tax=marine sediment metagenome TaxID=412755 RepID=A0A0F9VWX5_9ZZZZ
MSDVLHNVLHRFDKGISTVRADNPLAAMPYLDPTDWAIRFEDFLTNYDVSQVDSEWTFTLENACADAIVGPTGVMTLTNGGTDNDSGLLQADNQPWQTNSKPMLYECRAKLDKASGGDIAQSEMFIGLSSNETGTNFMNAGGTAREMDDAIGFIKYDGKATMDCMQGEANTFSTEVDAFTLVDDTWTVFTWYYDGSSSTKFWVNDDLKATLTSNVATSVMGPSFFVKDGEGKAQVLSVDYFLIAARR